MDNRIKEYRSKSMSDALNESVCSDRKFSENGVPDLSNSKNTSICQHSRKTKIRSVEEIQSFEERQESPTSKSHEFLKKIFTNSDKKNTSCKADNEFITRYYGRIDQLKEDCSRSLGYKEYPPSNYRTYTKRNLQREFESTNEIQNNLKVEKTVFHEIDLSARNQENCDFIDKLSTQKRDYFFFENNLSDPCNVRRQSSSCATLERHARKNVSRKKSFKQFLSSIIKWKKPGNKQNCKRYLSYDDLLDRETKYSTSDEDDLSRTVSLQNVILREKNEDSTDPNQRKLVVRSVHDSNKDELQKWVVEETKRLFLKEDSNHTSYEKEELVKPSTIKDIAKRHSRLIEVQQSEKNGNRVTRCKSVRTEQLYSRDKLLDNIETHASKKYVTMCATQM